MDKMEVTVMVNIHEELFTLCVIILCRASKYLIQCKGFLSCGFICIFKCFLGLGNSCVSAGNGGGWGVGGALYSRVYQEGLGFLANGLFVRLSLISPGP